MPAASAKPPRMGVRPALPPLDRVEFAAKLKDSFLDAAPPSPEVP